MLEPQGLNTKCIINGPPKKNLFCRANEAVILGGCQSFGVGGLTFDSNHPRYCIRKGHPIVLLRHVAREAHS